MRICLLFAAVLSGFAVTPALATTKVLDVAVENAGEAPLICSVAFAHWYSGNLGEAAPGTRISFSLSVDLDTGAVFQENTVGDRMAVQRVWCGLKGDDWRTRKEIPLEHRAGVMPEPVKLRCIAGADGTRCSAL